jgi:uncharacterized repeat protein (TIGR03943 family)
MSRETENALLLLLGLATAIITITGVYTRYVKPSLLPWLAAVAVLLIVLALSAIVRDLRRRRDDHTGRGDNTGSDEHAAHAHRRGIGWLIAVPVLLLAFVVPPALGAQAAAPISITLSPNELRQPFPSLPAGRAPEVSLKEVMKRVALDSAGTLNSRLITIVGFTLKADSGTDLARITIFCCAADAQLGRVHLRGPAAAAAAELPDNTWVRVEGTIAPPADAASPAIPTMTVSTLTRVDAPANTYAY